MTPTNSALALAWCLGWDQASLSELQAMRHALKSSSPAQIPSALQPICEQVSQLQSLQKSNDFPEDLSSLAGHYPALWSQTIPIGMVYGGATKIKSYLFEDAKLPDIRGASALLDQINQTDLPAFFSSETISETNSAPNADTPNDAREVRAWLTQSDNFPQLADALIPELIIYSTGGNILAFCPAPLVDDLADAIEKRYTAQTLTANSCAVGRTFRLLEMHFGRLSTPYEKTPWLAWYRQAAATDNPLVKAYFDIAKGDTGFQERKSFSELTTDLATHFNQRRNGNAVQCNGERSRRCYPPMFETHPYLRRDASDYRSAVTQPKEQDVPSQPWLSDTLARKRVTGQQTKSERSLEWFESSADFDWQLPADQAKWKPNPNNKSWVAKFKDFLDESPDSLKSRYYGSRVSSQVKEARDLADIGAASKNFVAYIYADGNNMGGYIQKQIKTPEAYEEFSQDIFRATEHSVYIALAQHLHPQAVKDNGKTSTRHPFEIVTIGGDDVFIIVPANKALEIAQTIGTKFEEILLKQHLLPDNIEIKKNYRADESDLNSDKHHRYRADEAAPADCQLSMSSGVLLAAQNTPIYYAEQLTTQLLKSAKQKAKALNTTAKQTGGRYRGGTVDFLVMKSVTMLAATVSAYREDALTHLVNGLNLRLYAAPYTLHELAGLIETLKALKASDLPRSQLYQIRSLLARGKRTAILNYRYFQSRLKTGKESLKEQFDESWCSAKTNGGNLAPWMYVAPPEKENETIEQNATKTTEPTYETIWRDLVDLFDFVELLAQPSTDARASTTDSVEVNS